MAKKLMLYNGSNKPCLNMGNVHRMENFFSPDPYQALAVEFVGDRPVGELHVSGSRLPLDLFFALNLDLAISVSTVFAKLPIAIAISRTPQTTTCESMHRL